MDAAVQLQAVGERGFEVLRSAALVPESPRNRSSRFQGSSGACCHSRRAVSLRCPQVARPCIQRRRTHRPEPADTSGTRHPARVGAARGAGRSLPDLLRHRGPASSHALRRWASSRLPAAEAPSASPDVSVAAMVQPPVNAASPRRTIQRIMESPEPSVPIRVLSGSRRCPCRGSGRPP